MVKLVGVLTVVAVVVLVVIGIGQVKSSSEAPSTATAPRAPAPLPADAPRELVAIRRQAGRLLPTTGFRARLRALRGTPVVVNKWASWCGPCRAEFPVFRDTASRLGGRIAFLGLNAADSAASARDFLSTEPVPYPSYEDPDEDIARSLQAASTFPATIFVRADGEVENVHVGDYSSVAALRRDIRRYALGDAAR